MYNDSQLDDVDHDNTVIVRHSSVELNGDDPNLSASGLSLYDNNDFKTELLTFGGLFPVEYLSTLFTFPIKNSQPVPWDHLLNTDNPARLIYMLKVINNVVNSTNDHQRSVDQIEIEKSKRWCAAFLQYGGVHQLLKLLMSIHLDEARDIRIQCQCLAPLLQLLSYFLCPLENSSNPTNISGLSDVTVHHLSDASLINPDESHSGGIAIVEAVALIEDEDDADDVTVQSTATSHAELIPTASEGIIVPTTASLIDRPQGSSAGAHSRDDDDEGIGGDSWTLDSVLQDCIGIEGDYGVLLDRILDLISGFCSLSTRSGGASPDGKQRVRRRNNRHARYESYFKPAQTDSGSGMEAASNTSTASSGTSIVGTRKSLSPLRTSAGADGNDASEGGEPSLEAQGLQHCLALVSLLTQHDAELISLLLSSTAFINNLLFMLLRSREESLRSSTCRSIGRVCRTLYLRGNSSVVSDVIGVLIPFIPETVAHEGTCAEFFYLFTQLVVIDNVLDGVDTDSLVFMLAEMIINKRAVEATEDDLDILLRGLLSLLRELLASFTIDHQRRVKYSLYHDKHLLDEIFHKCLFHFPGRRTSEERSVEDRLLPKCKSSSCREEALALLVELSTPCVANYQHVLTLVSPHHYFSSLPGDKDNGASGTLASNGGGNHTDDRMRSLKKQNSESTPGNPLSSPSRNNVLASKSKTGYCGLVNLGCVCYINSTLQQFYMIPAFREAILALPLQMQDDDSEDLLYQTQLLFANLQESEKAYYDPRGFCRAFKDIDGNPTDVLTQQDASEFVSNFLDKVETLLKDTPQAKLLKDVFGGTMSNELDAEGGKHSERSEDFYYISVEIGKGKSNLIDGLEKFIAEESVDYTWDDAPRTDGQPIVKQALPTKKRICFSSLPPHLIVHLMRYEFDLNIMQQIKRNDRFEFPLELDMYPYTKEGRNHKNSESSASTEAKAVDRSDYIYQLSGVVVHLGTASSGHYYSYIRERCSGDGSRGGWFEFNDGFVAEFDLDDLDEETFGGEEEWPGRGRRGGAASNSSTIRGRMSGVGGRSSSGLQSSPVTTRQKTRNAFLLVYDKVKAGVVVGGGGGGRERGDGVGSDDLKKQGRAVNSQLRRFRAPVMSGGMAEKIEQDNYDFWRRKYILDSKYYSFMSSLLTLGGVQSVGSEEGEGPSYTPETVQCAIRFALGTLVSGRERQLVHSWCKQLSFVLRSSSGYCEWFLEQVSDPPILKYLMLDVEEKDIRYSVAQTLCISVHTLNGVADQYLTRASSAESDDFSDCSASPVIRYVETVMGLLREAQVSWRRISFFFNPLITFCEGGYRQRLYMIRRGYLLHLMSFFLGSDTLYPELIWGKDASSDRLRSMNDGYNHADLRSLLSLLLELLRSCSLSSREDEYRYPLDPQASLSSKEQNLLEKPVFFYKLLKQIRAPSRKRLVWPLIERITFGSKIASVAAIDTVINSMRKEDGLDLKAPFRAAILLTQVKDCLQDWRVRVLVMQLIQEMQTASKYVYATEVSLVMLLRLAKASDVARAALQTNRSNLRWLDQWLTTRKSGGFPSQSMLYKHRRNGSSSKAERAPPPSYGGLVTSIRVMGGGGGISALHVLLRRVVTGESIEDTYDSDDEPTTLLNRRIKVRWSEGKWYAGTVVAYSESADLHEVLYDDGDRKTYRMVEKTWELLAERVDPLSSCT